jgi:uncharacterized protein YbjT (DUF2867 family)
MTSRPVLITGATGDTGRYAIGALAGRRPEQPGRVGGLTDLRERP